MKTWLSKIFGKEQKQPPAGGAKSVPPQVDTERTVPADVERTLPDSTTNDPHAIHAAEAQVAEALLAHQPQEAAEWKVGDVILDLYEVRETYEGGGMGLVYRVHHRDWDMDLAMKRPRAKLFETEEQQSRFSRECATWINLGIHRHIVSCYYVLKIDSMPIVFAEYAEGGSLKQWIDSGKLYEGGPEQGLAHILRVALHMASGLQYAHGQGVIHQDVKPANVMMSADGAAKITDFGLATAGLKEANAENILVSAGGMTPAYCSPEQAAGQTLTWKTDAWSWAVSVLEMFTGEVSWRSGAAASEFLAHLHESDGGAGRIPPMPSDLRALLTRCLTKDPEVRPSSMEEVATEVERVARHVGVQITPAVSTGTERRSGTLNNLAVSLLNFGDLEGAVKLLDTARGLEPSHLEATFNRGLLLWRNGNVTAQTFLAEMREAARIADEADRAAHLLGAARVEVSDQEFVSDPFEEALGNDPALRRLADLHKQVRTTLATQKRVHCSVEAVAPSADGRYVLVAGRRPRFPDNLWLSKWDEDDGWELEGHSGTVTSVAWLPDGAHAVSGGSDGTLRLWEMRTCACIRVIQCSNRRINSLSVSGDGKVVATGDNDGNVQLWDLQTGQCIRRFRGHEGIVWSVLMSEDQRLVLSAGHDKTLRLWEVANGRMLRLFSGHTDEVTACAATPGWQMALSGGKDHTLRLWDLRSGQCFALLQGHTGTVTSIAALKKRPLAISASKDGTLRLWDVPSRQCLRTFKTQKGVIWSVNLASDEGSAVSGGDEGLLQVWNIPISREIAPFLLAKPASAARLGAEAADFRSALRRAEESLKQAEYEVCAKFLRQARSVAGYRQDPSAVGLWFRLGLYGVRRSLSGAWKSHDVNSDNRCLALARDGSFALGACSDSPLAGLSSGEDFLWVWDLKSLERYAVLPGKAGKLTAILLSPDGRSAVSGHAYGDLGLWDCAVPGQFRFVRQMSGAARSRINCIAISGDARFVVLGEAERTVGVWSLDRGICLCSMEGHSGEVRSVALCPGGRYAISGSDDRTVRLWDLAARVCVRVFAGHTGSVMAVALSTDGRFALSGSCDKTIRMWNMTTGDAVCVLDAHQQSVTSIALSACNRFAVSGSEDNTVKLWRLQDGKCLKTFDAHTNGVTSVCFSSDSNLIVSGSRDKSIKVWHLDWDYDFQEPAAWDEQARPYLADFLTLHCSAGDEGVSRSGKPVWSGEDFEKFLLDLQYRGYGWLRPDGVRRELEKMTVEWKGPPPMPWEQPS